MKDPIERQDIINELESWLKVEGYSEGELNIIKAVLYEMQNMPSAQPEVIYCKYCKYSEEHEVNLFCKCWHQYTHWNGFCHFGNKAEDENKIEESIEIKIIVGQT